MNIFLSLLFLTILGIFSTSFMELYNLPKFLAWTSLLPFLFLVRRNQEIPFVLIILFILNNLFLLNFDGISYYTTLSVGIINLGIFSAICSYNLKKLNILLLLQSSAILLMGYSIYIFLFLNHGSQAFKSSTIGNSAYCGSLMSPIVLYSLICYLEEKYYNLKQNFTLSILLPFLIFIETIYLFLLQTRASFVSLIIGLIFYAIVKKHFKTLTAIVIVTLCSLLFVQKLRQGVVDYAQINLKNEKVFTGEQPVASNLARFIFHANSLEIVKKFPFFGIGAGQFQVTYPLFSQATYKDIEFSDEDHVSHPHDEAMNILVERGIIVFIFCVLILGFIIFSKQIPIVFRVSILSMIIDSLLIFTVHNPASSLMFWILVGFAVQNFPKNYLNLWKIRVPSLVISFVCIALTYPIIMNTLGSYYTRTANRTNNPQYAFKAFEYNPTEVLAALFIGNYFLKESNISEPLKAISLTRNIVPTFPHPYQNSARIIIRAQTEKNILASKNFYAISLMLLPSSQFSGLESARNFLRSNDDYLAAISLMGASMKYYVRDRHMANIECLKVWVDRNNNTRCP